MSAALLYSEIFEQFDKCTTRQERIDLLRKNGDPRFKTFLQLAFDPSVKFDVEAPPYRPAVEPAGMNFAYLDTEMNRMYRFFNHPSKPPITQDKQRSLLLVILEALHKDEAALMVKLFKKDLEINYLTPKLVKEAFPDMPFEA